MYLSPGPCRGGLVFASGDCQSKGHSWWLLMPPNTSDKGNCSLQMPCDAWIKPTSHKAVLCCCFTSIQTFFSLRTVPVLSLLSLISLPVLSLLSLHVQGLYHQVGWCGDHGVGKASQSGSLSNNHSENHFK